MVADAIRLDRLPIEAGHRRIEPHRLAQEQPQPRRPIGDIIRALDQRGLRFGGQLFLQLRLGG